MVDKTPARRSAVQSQDVADEMVLLDTEHDMVFSLNMPARAVWELCDGRRTVLEISRVLAEIVGKNTVDMRRDVEDTIREFLRLGVVTLEEPQSSVDV